MKDYYWTLELSLPTLLSRSRLYHLIPIGIGTPYIESLTSYLIRLASYHCVLVRDLLISEIMPLLGKTYLSSSNQRLRYSNITRFWKDSSTINSTSFTAQQIKDILESLTLCCDLQFLTMLSWSKVLSEKGLVRKFKAWCPDCYNEWLSRNKHIYDPLIWSLEVIDICTYHQKRLTFKCPYNDCQKQMSLVGPKAQPGFCYYCKKWLGFNSQEENNSKDYIQASELKQQHWVFDVVGELLQEAPNLIVIPDSKIFSSNISYYCEKVLKNNISECARQLGVSRRTVLDWKQGSQIPQLQTLLQICVRIEISPLQFLTSNLIDLKKDKKDYSVTKSFTNNSRKPVRVFEEAKIRQQLEAELMSTVIPPEPMGKIAKRLEYDHSYLIKHFPQLCRAISKTYEDYRGEKAKERKQHLFKEIYQAVAEINSQNLYPSQERVRNLLSQPGFMLEPDALNIWHDALLNLIPKIE